MHLKRLALQSKAKTDQSYGVEQKLCHIEGLSKVDQQSLLVAIQNAQEIFSLLPLDPRDVLEGI